MKLGETVVVLCIWGVMVVFLLDLAIAIIRTAIGLAT